VGVEVRGAEAPPALKPLPSRSAQERLPVLESAILAGVLVAAVAVRLHVISRFNINWDEFAYLSHVHSYLRGYLEERLQTFHVHFFTWLPLVGPNEVDQIVAARAVMLVLQLVTAGLLYRIARRWTSAPAALFAVAAYLSFSFVIRGGASFRRDPIALCAVMAALSLLLSNAAGLSRSVLAGLLLALAGLVTIKTSLFLPTVVVILAGQVLYGSNRGQALRRGAATVLSAAAGFAILYWLHTSTVHRTGSASSFEVAESSLAKTVIEAGLFPQREVLLATLRWDPVFWAFWLVGVVVVAVRIRQTAGQERWRWVELAALSLPMATLAVYRNSFPYFYSFILAPASVLAALTWQSFTPRRPLPLALKLLALTWMVASLILHGVYAPGQMPLDDQRVVLGEVHRMFPQPTSYLDRCSMVSSFPGAGFFMSTWGMEAYAQRGEPVLRRAIEERRPPLLVANHPLLDPANVVYPAGSQYRPPLLEPDREALEAAYVHHWGPIYVAGKRFEAPLAEPPARIDLLIGGLYTMESGGPVLIDGRATQPGQTIELTRGMHRAAGVTRSEAVTLRWGNRLYRPVRPPPVRPLFLGF
jgi:hypothetical protein